MISVGRAIDDVFGGVLETLVWLFFCQALISVCTPAASAGLLIDAVIGVLLTYCFD